MAVLHVVYCTLYFQITFYQKRRLKGTYSLLCGLKRCSLISVVFRILTSKFVSTEKCENENRESMLTKRAPFEDKLTNHCHRMFLSGMYYQIMKPTSHLYKCTGLSGSVFSACVHHTRFSHRKDYFQRYHFNFNKE